MSEEIWMQAWNQYILDALLHEESESVLGFDALAIFGHDFISLITYSTYPATVCIDTSRTKRFENGLKPCVY